MPFRFEPRAFDGLGKRIHFDNDSLHDRAFDAMTGESLHFYGRDVLDPTVPAEYIFFDGVQNKIWVYEVREARFASLEQLVALGWQSATTPHYLIDRLALR